MTDITCRIIVAKDKEFYMGQAQFPDGRVLYRFSPHMYDAQKFKNSKKAHEVAKSIKGKVCMMDALRGELI